MEAALARVKRDAAVGRRILSACSEERMDGGKG